MINNLEEIRERIDILAVASQYTKMTPQGSRWVGLCPVHDEKSPSFHVFPDQKRSHCFGCGFSGDVFELERKIKNLRFPEAVNSLAERFDIRIVENTWDSWDERDYQEREMFYQTNAQVLHYWLINTRLKQDNGCILLDTRWFSESAVQHFSISYAVDLSKYQNNEAVILPGNTVLNATGVINGQKSLFNGRIIFPIRNESGKIAGFAGRICGSGSPKYINSKNSPVYQKGQMLFGLFENSQAIRSKGEIILVEGYTDVLRLWEKNVKNVASICGTALTEGQIQIVKKYANQVTLLLDGDDAGEKATFAAFEKLHKAGLFVRVCTLPDKHDPESFAAERSEEALKKYLESETLDGIVWYVQRKSRDISSGLGKQQLSNYCRKFFQETPFGALVPDWAEAVEKILNASIKHLLPEKLSVTESTQKRIGHNNMENSAKKALINTPVIPAEVFKNLPDLLSQGCQVFADQRERDVFLTSALGILSGCIPNCKGNYDQHREFSNLFVFVVAPAASGKSALNFAKFLGEEIHQYFLRENGQAQNEYQAELAAYKNAVNKSKKGAAYPDEPQKPAFKLLYLPGNTSSAMLIKHLQDSGGRGILCETEADTISAAITQEWGSYSDLMRKAFQFEKIAYSRKASSEFYEIAEPKLSIVISGTPNQVIRLIPSVEDGLFSRFIFYAYAAQPQWRDVSPDSQTTDRVQHMNNLSKQVFQMWQFLNNHAFDFDLSRPQWQKLNALGGEMLAQTTELRYDVDSTVKRLGAILFRISMVLSACRSFEKGSKNKDLICADADFETAYSLVKVYFEHALVLYEWLPSVPSLFKYKLSQEKSTLIECLPDQFELKEALDKGVEHNLSASTIKRLLRSLVSDGVLEKMSHGSYQKVFASQ